MKLPKKDNIFVFYEQRVKKLFLFIIAIVFFACSKEFQEEYTIDLNNIQQVSITDFVDSTTWASVAV